jgi:hypothetical protein
MIKKIILSLLIVVFTGCGYQPIYLKGVSDFKIQKYELLGNKNINRKIISLLNFKQDTKNNSGYILTINSMKELQAVSKDTTGKTSVFKTSITVSIKLNKNDSLIKEKSFNSSFTYNNAGSKFDLLQYQKNIENNLVNKIYEEILIFLNT